MASPCCWSTWPRARPWPTTASPTLSTSPTHPARLHRPPRLRSPVLLHTVMRRPRRDTAQIKSVITRSRYVRWGARDVSAVARRSVADPARATTTIDSVNAFGSLSPISIPLQHLRFLIFSSQDHQTVYVCSYPKSELPTGLSLAASSSRGTAGMYCGNSLTMKTTQDPVLQTFKPKKFKKENRPVVQKLQNLACPPDAFTAEKPVGG